MLAYPGAHFLRAVSGRVNLLRSSGRVFRSWDLLNVKGFLVARALCVHMEETQFLDSTRHETSSCLIAHKPVDMHRCVRCISGLFTAGRGPSSLL